MPTTLTSNIFTLTADGTISLPADFIEADNLKPGDVIEWTRVRAGEYLMERKPKRRKKSLVQIMRECPEKDWFEQSRSGQTTDDLNVPDFE